MATDELSTVLGRHAMFAEIRMISEIRPLNLNILYKELVVQGNPTLATLRNITALIDDLGLPTNWDPIITNLPLNSQWLEEVVGYNNIQAIQDYFQRFPDAPHTKAFESQVNKWAEFSKINKKKLEKELAEGKPDIDFTLYIRWCGDIKWYQETLKKYGLWDS